MIAGQASKLYDYNRKIEAEYPKKVDLQEKQNFFSEIFFQKFISELEPALHKKLEKLIILNAFSKNNDISSITSGIIGFIKSESVKFIQSNSIQQNHEKFLDAQKIVDNAQNTKKLSNLFCQEQIFPIQVDHHFSKSPSDTCSKNSSKCKKRSWKHWTKDENKVYLDCLNAYSEQFDRKLRRKTRIFQKLSGMLNGSKTGDQCRGHHKKMMQNYGCIDNIKKIIGYKIDSRCKSYPMNLSNTQVFVQPQTLNAKELHQNSQNQIFEDEFSCQSQNLKSQSDHQHYFDN